MHWPNRIREFWKDLFLRKQQEQELDAELQFHLEMQEMENRRSGMNNEDAQRSARMKLGGTQLIKEVVREQRYGFSLETIHKDAVLGLRVLRRTLGLSLVSLVTLALAIGACTALFSVFHAILLRPLPYPQSDRLVQIFGTNVPKGIERGGVSPLNLDDWRQRSNPLDGIAAYYTMGRTLSSDNSSEVVLASQVSADFFRIFRTRPMLGRTFTEEESERTEYNNALGLVSSDPVAVISYGLWKRRFGGDQQIVERTIVVDRRAHKIIGVMPPRFAVPVAGTELWLPWGLRHPSTRDQYFASAVARLPDGTTLPQAEERLNAVVQQLAREFPESAGWGIRMVPLQEAIAGDMRSILWVLLPAVGVVLMIACANIAILQLSRASARMHESAMRLALGASRGRLIRQFLVESLLLALAGGAMGVLLAYVGINWLHQLQPDLPRLAEVSIDRAVLMVSIGLTVFSVLLFGLAPAFVGARGTTDPLFHGEGSRTTARLSTQRLRNALVIVEVALAVVLLASSGMLIRSFARLRAVDPGFNPRNVLVAPIFLDTEKYGSGEKSRAYYKQLIESLEALPGVASVGGATALPASPLGPDFERPVWEQGSLAVQQNKSFADVRVVTPDYFRTLGISVRDGRGFSNHDRPDSPGVVIINETLAHQVWPRGHALGKQLVVDYSTAGTYAYEIVGVVNDVRFHGLRSKPRPEIYFPHAQKPYLILNIAVRTKEDPRLLVGSVREVLRRLDPQKPAHNITPLEDLVDATVIRDRYAMTLVSCFATVAVLLALLAIYGVLASFVRQRVPEIGIRMALGASQSQIVRWITRQGLHLILAGLVAGLLIAMAFTRLMTSILFEIDPLDPWSLMAAAVLFLLTAAVACWIPARRASRIEPSVALRYE